MNIILKCPCLSSPSQNCFKGKKKEVRSSQWQGYVFAWKIGFAAGNFKCHSRVPQRMKITHTRKDLKRIMSLACQMTENKSSFLYNGLGNASSFPRSKVYMKNSSARNAEKLVEKQFNKNALLGGGEVP